MSMTTQAEAKSAQEVSTAVKPLGVQLKERESQFHAALPAHIPVERFMRVVMTAVQNNPELAKADRASLFNASMRAAQDGLLPDGREGALVIYKTKSNGEWIAKVSWMPMIAGIRKKVRNSDEIATWDVQTVHAKDHFEFELGDDPFIKHRPHLGDDRGPMVAVYSVAVLKSGEKSRDVMSRSDVDYIRDTYSKRDRDGKFSGAWTKSYDEMAKKTVARRHSKVLPMSTDLDDLLRRDDELYDIEAKSDKQLANPPKTLGARLDMLAAGEPDPPHDPETGEITETTEERPQLPGAARETTAPVPPPDAVTEEAASSGKEPPNGAGDVMWTSPAPDDLLANLLAEGDARASAGPSALRNWLDELPPAERKMLPALTVKGWGERARSAVK